MRIVLRDLTPGSQYAVQFRSNDGAGNVSEWSQITRFTTTNDTLRPGNVVNLSFFDTGDSLMAAWDAVTLNQDGTPFNDFRSYHVQVTDGTATVDYYPSGNRFELSREMNIAAFGTYKNNLTIKVWAVDLTHNESLTAATATAAPATPPNPSTPTVSTYLGLLLVSWDGKQANGSAMPINVNYCEVHVSTVSNFTPSASTLAGKVYPDGSASKTTLTGLAYGTLYYVRLVAVSFAGKTSSASTQASGTPTRISGLDITNGAIGTSQINFSAYDIGGANAYYPATTTAMNALTGVKNGDIAYVTGSGYATYRYNGTSWVSAPEIGQISGTKILAGTVTSNAVGTNLLITSSANIGSAVIDQANIATVNAASIVTGQLAANQKIIAGPSSGTHAELTSTGLRILAADPVDGVPNEVIRLGTTDNSGNSTSDYFGVTNNNGVLVASVDDTGSFNGRTFNVKDDPIIMGQNFSDWVGDIPGGLISTSFFVLTPDFASRIQPIGPEYGLVQHTFPVQAGRTYLFVVNGPTFDAGTSGSEAQFRLRSAMGRNVVIATDPEVWYNLESNMPVGPWRVNKMTVPYSATTSGDMSLLLTMAGNGGVFGAFHNVTFTVFDMGQTKGGTTTRNTGGGTLSGGGGTNVQTLTKQYYVDLPAVNRATYRGNGTLRTDVGNDIVQGYDPSGFNGDGSGWWTFNLPSITGTVDRVDVYAYSYHWYYNSGGTAIWNIIKSGTGWPLSGIKLQSDLYVAGYQKPGGKTITLPSSWYNSFKDSAGANKVIGLSLGPSGGTNLTYYGKFNDVRLRIWYTQ